MTKVKSPALQGGALVNQEGIYLRFATSGHSSLLFRARHPGRSSVIPRTSTTNLTAGFQKSLSLTEPTTVSVVPARFDQQVLRLVSGRDATVSYLSLAAALKAQEDGISIHILTVDPVDPGEATVKNGLSSALTGPHAYSDTTGPSHRIVFHLCPLR